MALVATAIAIAAAATAFYGRYWLTAQAVALHRDASLPTAFGAVHWLTSLGLSHARAAQVAGVAFVAVYLVLLRDAWRTGRHRLALAATALVLTSALIRPWYALWALALAATEGDAAGGAVAVGLSAYLLLADAVPL